MMGVAINHIAVVVAALSAVLLGAVFHSQRFLKKPSPYRFEDVPAVFPFAQARLFVLSALGTLVTAYALAYLFRATHVADPALGMLVALIAWFAFVLSHAASNYFYSKGSLRPLLFEMSEKAAEYAVMGVILGAWR